MSKLDFKELTEDLSRQLMEAKMSHNYMLSVTMAFKSGKNDFSGVI